MGKKVFQLAKALNLSSKDVQAAAISLEMDVSPLKTLSDEEVQKISEFLMNSEATSTDAGAGKKIVRRRRTPAKKTEAEATPPPPETAEEEKSEKKAKPEKTTEPEKTAKSEEPAAKAKAPKSKKAVTEKTAEKVAKKATEKTKEKTTEKASEKTTEKTAEKPKSTAKETKIRVEFEEKAQNRPSPLIQADKPASESSKPEPKPGKFVVEDSSAINPGTQAEGKKTISIKESAPGPADKKKSANKSPSSKKVQPAYVPSGRTEIKVIATKDEYDVAMESIQSKRTEPENAPQRKIDDPKGKKKHKQKFFFEESKEKPKRRGGKWASSDGDYYGAKGLKKKKAKVKHTFNARKKDIVISDRISVSDLAGETGIKAGELIKSLMNLGEMVTVNNMIDGETAQIILTDFGIDVKVEKKKQLEDYVIEQTFEDKPENYRPRPPVITVMGHVDHGKTSLLDKIRSSDVAGGEAGGITQHIAAYHVETKQGMVTFLDTPGHEAFTSMRARGANATDIVILVIAADDGPMPQTVEAINHAKAAEVPIIVAVNKCDKPGANPEKTMQQLMEHGLVSEEYGGDCTMVRVSAQTGDGIDELLEMALLQAETMELKANIKSPAQGVVIESSISKGRGNMVTVLVQHGVFKVGDCLLAGLEFGRVRSLIDDRGKTTREIQPGFPVAVLGLNGLPASGETFHVMPDEKSARQIVENRRLAAKKSEIDSTEKVSMENLFESMTATEVLNLNVVIKGDVIGSVEAVRESLSREGNEKVAVNILHCSVGAISSSDVTLASASKAIILGFNVRPDSNAKRSAAETGVEIRLYSVIYDIIEDVRSALVGMLKPIVREDYLGKAEILETFNIPKIGMVAGGKVLEGKVASDAHLRVLRDNIVIHEGKLASLKRFKDDVKEVHEGFECGFTIESYKNIQPKDICEFVYKTEVKASLDAP